MFEIGGKYICGGRTFWCVDIDGCVDLCSAGSHIFVEKDSAMFKKVGQLEPGQSYKARLSFSDFKKRDSYTVKAVQGREVLLSNGVGIPLDIFASMFYE